MKRSSYGLFAISALTLLGLSLTGCAQQPAASAAPAAAPAQPTTVIENVHHDDADEHRQQDRDRAPVHVDIHASVPDRDHPRPEDAH
jgi:hypothetical protein